MTPDEKAVFIGRMERMGVKQVQDFIDKNEKLVPLEHARLTYEWLADKAREADAERRKEVGIAASAKNAAWVAAIGSVVAILISIASLVVSLTKGH